MEGRLDEHATVASLLSNREGLREAIKLLNALDRLEVVLTVNGTTKRYPVRYSGTGAYIEVEVTT